MWEGLTRRVLDVGVGDKKGLRCGRMGGHNNGLCIKSVIL